jgi:threonine/homoserine/homoserine lactone efflux protein
LTVSPPLAHSCPARGRAALSLAQLLITSFLTGLAVAIPIGPVNLEILRRTLRQGMAAGMAVGMGAVCIDALYLVVFSIGLGGFLSTGMARDVFFLLGGGVLTWLGVGALREARAHWMRRRDPAAGAGLSTDRQPRHPGLWALFALGLAMTSVSPYTVAFWAAMSLQFVQLDAVERLVAAVALMGGCTAWTVIYSGAIALWRRRIGAATLAVLTLGGGLVVLGFGLRFLWSAGAAFVARAGGI